MITCPQCGTSYPETVRLCPRDGAVLEGHTPTEERLVGTVLDGKYRIEAYLSSGGMGAVFRATHVMLGKPVAVKLIQGDLVTSPEMARRFQREARAATSLNHPCIVSVYDLGQTGDGTLYIAMELVDGQSLKDEIRAQGRIEPARIVRLLRDVASALAVAHRHQIIHRDLKPQNVMLTRDSNGREVAKLLDFGIAKTLDEAQTQLTAAGFALGTPQYMSPEQAMGKEVDPRSDLYSLGVVMYEMLVGEVPFTAPSTSAILIKHLTELPAHPSKRRPDIPVPATLEAIVLRCLEKEPANRYQTAEEFAAALDAEAAGDPTAPTAVAAADATTVLVGTAGAASAANLDTAAATPAPLGTAATSAAGPVSTRPTIPAAVQPEFAAKPGSSLSAFGAIAAVCVLIAALGGVLWLITGGASSAPDPVTAGAEPTAPDATPATALPGDQPAPLTDPAVLRSGSAPEAPAGDAAGAGTPGPGVPALTTPAAGAAAGPGASPASSITPPSPASAASGGEEKTPSAGRPGGPARDAASASSAAAPTPVAARPAPATPAPAQPAPAAMPPDPSVFVECRGAAAICGAVRAAFDQALQRERLPLARSSDRADVVLIAVATLIDERREQQFGQTMAVRTYAIEILGDAPRLDRVIPMPSPRTFSFDQRFGAEKANENARVVAIDAVGRVREFFRKPQAP
jgi:eukaryotic-like serine/threonine-protein kinase